MGVVGYLVSMAYLVGIGKENVYYDSPPYGNYTENKYTDLAVGISVGGKFELPPGLFPQKSEELTKERYHECINWLQKAYWERGLELLRGNNAGLIERLGISKTYYFDRKRELGIGVDQDMKWL